MQSENFKSLLSPPWPLTEEPSVKSNSSQSLLDREKLSNFERNEKSEENLDPIAVLGYN
jgi:hypothetical protein